MYNDDRQEQQQKRQFNNNKIVSIDKRSEEQQEAKSMAVSTEKDPAWALVMRELSQGFREKREQSKKQILCNDLPFRMASERTFFSVKGHEQVL